MLIRSMAGAAEESGSMTMSTACSNSDSEAAQLVLTSIVLPFFSVIIMVILSYTQQRRRASTCVGGCHGRMGLPIPMNFLISPQHRLLYIVLFPLLASDVFSTVMAYWSAGNVSNIVVVSALYKVLFLPALATVFLALRYFPLFACVEAPLPFLGHCLGLAYSALWLIVEAFFLSVVYHARVCVATTSTSLTAARVAFAFQVLPPVIFAVCVVSWYAKQVLVASLRKLSNNPDLLEAGFYSPTGTKDYQLKHIQKLFSCPPPTPERGKWTTLFWTVFRYFIPYSRYRRLPVVFIGVVVAMVMFVYQASMELLIQGFLLADLVSSHVEQWKSSSDLPKATEDAIGGLLVGLPVAFILSLLVSLGMSLFLIMHMVSSVSKMMKVVAKHGFTEKLPSPPYRAPLAIKYFGLQFGFFVVAWLLYLLLSFLALGVAVMIIIGLRFYTKSTLDIVLGLIIPVLWYKGVFYSQFLICKFVFFKDLEGKFLALNNYRLFNCFAFVMMIYNWFAGFLGAIFRILLSAGISLLLLFRLDIFVLTTGFEFLDFGHRAFLGFMYLDYCYNNAVVHTFIHTLKGGASLRGVPNSAQPQHRKGDYVVNPHVTITSKNRQCLNRWLVAYTLLRNPSIQHSTAANIAAASAAANVTTSGEDRVASPTLEVFEVHCPEPLSPEPLLQFRSFD